MGNNTVRIYFLLLLLILIASCKSSVTPPTDGDPPPIATPTPKVQPTPTPTPAVKPVEATGNRLMDEALTYRSANLSRFANKNYVAVIDFSMKSSEKRLFIRNMQTGKTEAFHVAHGQGSDANHDGYAEKFSNVANSHASSLGFYKTAETYSGKHGYSLRLDGLSSTNSNARARAIVMHGAAYVTDQNKIQGRSWGCPAVSMANHKRIIDILKGGALLYIGK